MLVIFIIFYLLFSNVSVDLLFSALHLLLIGGSFIIHTVLLTQGALGVIFCLGNRRRI